MITDFIPPEWIWGAVLVALIVAVAARHSLTSRDRDWWEDQSDPTPRAIGMTPLISIIVLVLSLLLLALAGFPKAWRFDCPKRHPPIQPTSRCFRSAIFLFRNRGIRATSPNSKPAECSA